MSNLRTTAVKNISRNSISYEVNASEKVSTIFNENVFTLKTARHYLSDESYKSLQASTFGGKKIDRSMGSNIANGMKLGLKKRALLTLLIGFNHSLGYQQKNMILFLH